MPLWGRSGRRKRGMGCLCAELPVRQRNCESALWCGKGVDVE